MKYLVVGKYSSHVECVADGCDSSVRAHRELRQTGQLLAAPRNASRQDAMLGTRAASSVVTRHNLARTTKRVRAAFEMSVG